MHIQAFRNVMPCRFVKSYLSFGVAYCLRFRFQADCVTWNRLRPEDVANSLCRNVSSENGVNTISLDVNLSIYQLTRRNILQDLSDRPTCHIKCGKLLELLSNCWFLKEDSSPWH